MKKLYTENKYKRYQARCIRREQRVIKRGTACRKNYIVNKNSGNTRLGDAVYKTVSAPSRFCIKENPNDVVRFINKLNVNFEKRVSLSNNVKS